MNNYEQERLFFSRLKAECSVEAKISYEYAIKKLIYSYNTAIDENKFTVGRVVEIFTYGLFRATGITCFLNEGAIHFDRKRLDVQGIFSGGFNDSHLINYRGSEKRKWETARLFVISGVGIVFADPSMVEEKHLNDTKSALVLKKAGLQKIASDEKNVFSIEIVKKPDTRFAEQSKKASDSVARSILRELVEAFEQ